MKVLKEYEKVRKGDEADANLDEAQQAKKEGKENSTLHSACPPPPPLARLLVCSFVVLPLLLCSLLCLSVSLSLSLPLPLFRHTHTLFSMQIPTTHHPCSVHTHTHTHSLSLSLSRLSTDGLQSRTLSTTRAARSCTRRSTSRSRCVSRVCGGGVHWAESSGREGGRAQRERERSLATHIHIHAHAR